MKPLLIRYEQGRIHQRRCEAYRARRAREKKLEQKQQKSRTIFVLDQDDGLTTTGREKKVV